MRRSPIGGLPVTDYRLPTTVHLRILPLLKCDPWPADAVNWDQTAGPPGRTCRPRADPLFFPENGNESGLC